MGTHKNRFQMERDIVESRSKINEMMDSFVITLRITPGVDDDLWEGIHREWELAQTPSERLEGRTGAIKRLLLRGIGKVPSKKVSITDSKLDEILKKLNNLRSEGFSPHLQYEEARDTNLDDGDLTNDQERYILDLASMFDEE